MSTRLRLLVVDDEPLFLESLERLLAGEGMAIRTAREGEAALRELAAGPVDVVLADITMPGMDGLELLRRVHAQPDGPEVVLLTAHGTIETAVEAMRRGAYDFLQKPAEPADIERVVRRACEKVRLARENLDLRRSLRRHDPYTELVGSSPAMSRVRDLIARVAPTDTTVLIVGESGVGKELVARRIHAHSGRAEAPFLTLDCASLPATLLANELFGHVAGAFTGAAAGTQGLFEAADGGTLFIDEVGEMDLEIQKAFLRVLESGEFRRVGEARARHADVRVVAATNRDLAADVESGRFRKDLFYRLNVFPLPVPPLRERPTDLPELTVHLLRALEPHRQPPRTLTAEAMAALAGHTWPGNVRELRNALERGVILARGPVLGLEDLPPLNSPDEIEADSPTPEAGPASRGAEAGFPPLAQLEREHLVRALDAAGGNKTVAARLLGLSLRALYTRLDRHGLPR